MCIECVYLKFLDQQKSCMTNEIANAQINARVCTTKTNTMLSVNKRIAVINYFQCKTSNKN